MGWDGSGAVNLSQDFIADALAGPPLSKISSAKMDDVLEDLADAIQATLNRNGENAVAANINWGGFKITNLGPATAANDAPRARQIAENALQSGGTTGGTANAYTVTNAFLTTLAAGTRLLCLANHTNDGNASLTVNGGTTYTIYRSDGSTNIQPGAIVNGRYFEVVFTGTSFVLSGYSAEGLTALDVGVTVQAYDADLAALAALTSAADRLPYFTGTNAAAVTPFTAFGRSLVDDADAAAGRATLGVVIGTNVQAFDAELAAIAGLTSAADRLPYFTGSGAASLATFTAAGRALVDDADAAAQRTTLGLVIGTNVQAQDAELSAIAGLVSAADRLPYFTGSGTAALATFTTAGRALVDDADAAAQRTTLGLSANGSSLVTAANYAAMRGLLDLEAGTDFYSISAANAAFAPISHTHPASQISDASANGRSLLTSASYAAMRALLDLEAGTDFYSKAAADAMFQLKGVFDIRDYGAVGDGVTDNTAAIQDCLDAIFANGGGRMLVPAATFLVAGELTYDISAISSSETHRLSIVGAQKSVSRIYYTGSDICFSYIGNSGAFQQGYLQVHDLSFEGTNAVGSYGMTVDEAAFSSFRDANFQAFDYCFGMIDVDQADFTGCTFRNGIHGVQINIGTSTTTGPNSLVFINCNVSNNSEWGMHCVNPQAVTFIGGSIQYNGDTVGDSSMWGLKFQQAGTSIGYSTINFIGTIFEGNTGLADLWIDDYDNNFLNVTITGCSFYRTWVFGSTYGYSTNGLRADGTSVNTRYSLSGNTWFSNSADAVNNYSPNAGRAWIGAVNANAKFYTDGSDYFLDALESPAFANRLHLPSGSGLSLDFGDITLLHSSNTLTLSGGTLVVPSLTVAGVSLDGAWTAYNPVPAAETGTYTNVTCAGAYKQIGKTVHWRGRITFTNVTGGSGYCQLTLPNSTTFSGDYALAVFEWNTGGDLKVMYGANGASVVRFRTPPGFGSDHASGDQIPFNFTYEAA